MGQLKDTLVSGNLRVTDDILANKINGVTVGNTPEFTDTKVTSVGNHYTPATDSGAALSASASGASAAWSIDVVKGVTLSRDAKGHVTGVSVTSGKIPAKPTLDDISDGSTRKLANYLPLTGGSLTGALSISKNVPNLLSLYRSTNDGGAFIDMYHNGQTTNYWRIGSAQDGKFMFFESGVNAKVTLTTDGKLGIGRITPSTALDVVGDIMSTGYIRASGNNIYVGSTSGSQCHQQYDTTNKCLKFIFD